MGEPPAGAHDRQTVAAPTSAAAGRLHELLRDVFCGGLAGLIAGVVFLGAGLRLVMRGIALLNPESRGLITDNQNVVGEITTSGTADLVIGTGLFAGIIVGAVWVMIRDWLPIHAGLRMALAGVLAALLGSFFVVSADNPDFHRLDNHPALNVVMFVSAIGVAGAATAGLDEVLRPRLPAGRVAARMYAPVLLLAGLPALFILIVAFFLGDDETQNQPPRLAGLFLVAVALSTLAGWRRYVRSSNGKWMPPRWQRKATIAALAAATFFAALDLAGEIQAIV